MKNYEIKNYDKIIKEHYDQVALKDKDKVSCTMDNDFVRDEETKFIIRIIKNYLLEKKILTSKILKLWMLVVAMDILLI